MSMMDMSPAGYSQTPAGQPGPNDVRRRIAMQLMQEGSAATPIQSPWQGAARVAQALMGGLELYGADKQEQGERQDIARALTEAQTGQGEGGVTLGQGGRAEALGRVMGSPYATPSMQHLAAALATPQAPTIVPDGGAAIGRDGRVLYAAPRTVVVPQGAGALQIPGVTPNAASPSAGMAQGATPAPTQAAGGFAPTGPGAGIPTSDGSQIAGGPMPLQPPAQPGQAPASPAPAAAAPTAPGQGPGARLLYQAPLQPPDHIRTANDIRANWRQYVPDASGPDDRRVVDLIQRSLAGGVTINNQAETAAEHEVGQARGQRQAAVEGGYGRAQEQLSRVNMLGRLLTGLNTGPLAEGAANIGAIASQVGIPPDTLRAVGIDPALATQGAAARAEANRLVMGMIGTGGFPANNFSNPDREFLQRIVPGLANRPEANDIMLEVARRQAMLQIEQSQAWDAYQNRAQQSGQRPEFNTFERQWRDQLGQRDIFGDIAQRAGQVGQPGQTQQPAPAAQTPSQPPADLSTLPRPTSREELMRLPSGAWFVDPDNIPQRRR